MWFWWALAAFVALAVVFWVVGGAKYRVILAPEHLLEIGRSTYALRERALADIDDADDEAPPDPDDPRAFRSSAGVLVHYTITGREDRFDHHVSLSYPPDYPAFAVGHRLCSYLARILQWPAEGVQLGVSPRRIFHMGISLTDLGMERYAAAVLPELTPELVKTLWLGDLLDMQRMEDPLAAS